MQIPIAACSAEPRRDFTVFLTFLIQPQNRALWDSRILYKQKEKNSNKKMKGVAVFSGIVEGNATFEDSSSGLKIKATFTKLPEGDHGFHIHTNGDMRDEGCMGACSHFNKGAARNHGGAPGHAEERHTGDLGNVNSTNHMYRYTLEKVRCEELFGRTLIVHADPDDLGKGVFSDSLTTGHAGKRIACALIGRAKDCVDKKTRKTTRIY